mmetsp:Transcript_67376/g.157904  ORF Transcript_67376/g.157904 Transcript_67376/m.157904 type:complete len:220 (+) Transcript_67376:112-771(+)
MFDSPHIERDEAPHPQATSLVLKRLPPRCSTSVLLEVLDIIAARYDYVHLPLDHRTNKNMSMAFVNFVDHEEACVAFRRLSRPNDFPHAFAPSTKAVWGAIHGLGPNLAHFVVRYGPAALDPPCAPLVFLNCRCVPRTQTLLRDFVTTEMLEVAATFLQSQTSTVSPLGTLGAVSRGEARASTGSRSEMARQSMSLSEIAAELTGIPSYSRDGHVVYQL